MDIDYETCEMERRKIGERNDCAVKAVAIVCQIPYEEAREALANDRSKGGGTKNGTKDYCKPVNREIEKRGFTMKRVKCKSKTLKTLKRNLKSRETFVVFSGGAKRGSNHVSVIRNGVFEDHAGDACKPIRSIWVVR